MPTSGSPCPKQWSGNTIVVASRTVRFRGIDTGSSDISRGYECRNGPIHDDPAEPLSSHLLRLWRTPAARERIVDAACLELENWDGSGLEEVASGRPIIATRLLAFLRTFPRPAIEFNLMLPFRSDRPDIARFEMHGGEVQVPTVAGPGGSISSPAWEG